MNLFKHLSLRLNVSKKVNCKRNEIRFVHTLKQIYFHSESKATIPLVSQLPERKVQWNFRSIDSNKSKVDCLLVLNNDHINKNWITKVLPQTQNILLADGGANIFYTTLLQKGQRYPQLIKKIKAVIGDLDSVTDEARRFYKTNGIKIMKQFDQQKNDFQKTLLHGLQLNCKNFIVSGAFGNRLDHSLSTMSITQKYTKNFKDLNIILSNKQSIYCPLRAGLNHKFYISQDIQKSGCGIVTFGKISHIETKCLKWNLGEKEKYNSIQWGSYLSTSNRILNDQFQVTFDNDKSEVAYFVASLKKDSK